MKTGIDVITSTIIDCVKERRGIAVNYLKEFNLSEAKAFNIQEAKNANVFTRDGRQVTITLCDPSRNFCAGEIYDVYKNKYIFTGWHIDGTWDDSEPSDLDLFIE